MGTLLSGAIFISGGTSGLGLQTAEHFVKKGKNVIICGRNLESVEYSLKKLEGLSHKDQQIRGFSCDVASKQDVEVVFEKLAALGMEVSIAVCNAGVIGPIGKFLENEPEKWREALNINLYGTSNLISSVLPGMIYRQTGRIIHISGGGATSPLFGMTSYAASKAAAVRFIETLALEYANNGVTFNSVAPGMLKTKLLDQMLEAGPINIGQELYSKSSQKAEALSDSSEKAIRLINFLASEESVGITGKLISAEWDNWDNWLMHLTELKSSDVYTIRRITGRDRGLEWGDH